MMTIALSDLETLALLHAGEADNLADFRVRMHAPCCILLRSVLLSGEATT